MIHSGPNQVTHMDELALEVGDILFDMDASGIPSHVSIYAGKRAGQHFMTHAVTGNYNSIMTTVLKPDYFPRRVFRSKDRHLALNVVLRMNRWVVNQIPFSFEKHDEYIDRIDEPPFCHPNDGISHQSEHAQDHFAPNFFRYIEYAAHPDLPFYPQSNMPGFYCSEAIVAAYQIESLLMLGAVKPQAPGTWVCDDFKTDLPTPRGFKEYQYRNCKLLVDHKENESIPLTIRPSFSVWNRDLFGDDIIAFAEEAEALPLRLDSELASPGAIYDYFLRHPKNWLDCGQFEAKMPAQQPPESLEADKEKWRDYVSALFANAYARRQRAASSSNLHKSIAQTDESSAHLKKSASTPSFSTAQSLSFQSPSSLIAQLELQWQQRVSPFVSPHKKAVMPKLIRDVCEQAQGKHLEEVKIRRKLFL